MRLPRMTTRWWMAVVATIGTVFGVAVELQRRRDRFLAMAAHHEASCLVVYAHGPGWASKTNALGENVRH